MALMTQRGYARHRGITHHAVQKAIAAGRISAALRGKKIDSEIADGLWPANTDPTKPKARLARGQEAARTAPPGGNEGAHARPGPAPSGPTYASARGVREQYLAEHARIDLEVKTGRLIEVAQVRLTAQRIGRRVGEALATIPDRLAPIMAAEGDIAACHRIMADDIARIRADLADAIATAV